MGNGIIRLVELIEVLGRKYYFSLERFTHYFTILGIKDTAIKEYWFIWENFPYIRDQDIEKASFVLDKILAYPKPVYQKGGDLCYEKSKESQKKVYYKCGEEIKNFEVNFNETEQVILYADFLKREPEIIVAVDLYEKIYHNSKTICAYEGDFFATRDSWNRDRDGDVYVCTRDGYRKLLYTKGRGYIRNCQPDYGKEKYSSYVITGKDKFNYMGNIYADPSFLIDGDEDDEEEEKRKNANTVTD